MSAPTTLLPFQPATMSTAQPAAVSYLALYSGLTHALYTFQLRGWFTWCEANGLDADRYPASPRRALQSAASGTAGSWTSPSTR